MIRLVELGVRQHKASFSLIAFVLLAGLMARASMTIETYANVTVPIVLTSVVHRGISPEDGARLLAKPIEQELRSIDGIIEVISTAREGTVYVTTEFDTNIDIDIAVQNTREAVDRAKAEFPENTEEPFVSEVSAGSNLILVVSFLSEVAGERELYQLAKEFREDIEAIPDVLEANLVGAREEVAEVHLDPERMEFYGITAGEMTDLVRNNNLLIPAGDLDAGYGNFGVKVPSLVESVADLRALPVRSTTEGVITLAQIADVRRTFKDATGFSRVNGNTAMAINISKRLKANTVDTVQRVRDVIERHKDRIPANVDVEFIFDQAQSTKQNVDELTGNVVSALALVMVIVVASLGFRSGLLVGFGIPFSLLGSGIVVYLVGYSFNFMVIFGLLLSLGMLIDGAIVVAEYANRMLSEGKSAQEAYLGSVKRMAVPIIASTLTTLAAFLPMIFWPGIVGDFMKILPVTVFSVLIWSLVFSLLVVPILGIRLASRKARAGQLVSEGDSGIEFEAVRSRYLKILGFVLDRPVRSTLCMLSVLVAIYVAFIHFFNPGVVFASSESEAVFTTMSVRAQGNLTVDEKIQISRKVEARLADIPEVKSYYFSSADFEFNGSSPRDQIASVLLELKSSLDRELSSNQSLDKIRERTRGIPGVIVQVNKMEAGPPVGKDVQVEMSSENRTLLHDSAHRLREYMETMPGLIDVEDTLSLPGVEWNFEVDKASAAMIGVDVAQVGQVIQMVTDGLYLGEFRPDDADDEVEIRLRFPDEYRSIDALRHLRLSTPTGSVPLDSFVTMEPKRRVDVIQRIDSKEYINVSAYTREGVFAADMVDEIETWMLQEGMNELISYRYRGASEETEQSNQFLATAFSLAMFLMLIILVAQFNSFYQAALIISAVVMSTAGVLLGLMLTQSPFTTLLTGVGLVALAGIVVNNNIVLIDTFNRLRDRHADWSGTKLAMEAAKRRFRPVLLTTLTTVIGLMPLANGASVDLVNREIILGGEVATFWSPLASTIVNGLIFSTLLTLLLTPTMLVLPTAIKQKFMVLWQQAVIRFGGLSRQ